MPSIAVKKFLGEPAMILKMNAFISKEPFGNKDFVKEKLPLLGVVSIAIPDFGQCVLTNS